MALVLGYIAWSSLYGLSRHKWYWDCGNYIKNNKERIRTYRRSLYVY